MLGPEHARSDIARFAALFVEIGGLEKLNVVASLKFGEPQLGRQQADPLPEKTTDKARGEIEAQSIVGIARDNDSWTIEGRLVQQPEMDFARYVANNQFAAVGVGPLRQNLAECRGVERKARIQAARCWCEDQRAG